MIASGIGIDHSALENRERAINQRNAFRALPISGSVEAVLVFRREAPRHHLLVLAEDVYRERFALVQVCMKRCTLINANEDKGRFERERRKSAHGDSDSLAIIASRGYDRNTTRKSPKRGSEFILAYSHPFLVNPI
jgi:hypothetical protein